jgi:hypothetical protein
MPYRQHRHEPDRPPPNEAAMAPSPALRIVVDVWCDIVANMDRVRLDVFTRDRWRRFDPADLAPLKAATLGCRRIHARRHARP